MTKNELLLKMAIDACNWGEGADFEMTELIHEGNYENLIRQHYVDELFGGNAHVPEYDDPDYDEDNPYGPAWDDDKVCSYMRNEMVQLLYRLKENCNA